MCNREREGGEKYVHNCHERLQSPHPQRIEYLQIIDPSVNEKIWNRTIIDIERDSTQQNVNRVQRWWLHEGKHLQANQVYFLGMWLSLLDDPLEPLFV
jgi:hypothetical protein